MPAGSSGGSLRVHVGWALVAVSALTVMGCASVGSVQRADTLGTGNVQFALEPGAPVYVGTRGLAPAPAFDASLRIGVAERLDLGARVGFPWAEAQVKVLLTEPGHPRLAMSLAPTFGVTVLPTNGAVVSVVHASLPFLAGVKFGEHELVLGPRAMLYRATQSTAGTLLGAGASIGLALQLTKTFGVLPELAFVVPFATVGGQGFSAAGAGDVLAVTQVRLGLLFGRQGRRLEAR